MSSNLNLKTTAKRALCLWLSVSMTLTSLLPSLAQAQTVTCSPYSADNGTQKECGARRIGNIPVAYPKLQWHQVGEFPVVSAQGTSRVTGEPASVAMANKAALVLGLKSSDIVSMANVFPSNVPYVFARYNPMSKALTVDVFKIEKVPVGSGTRAGLYHAAFGPAQGDFWKANRAYISPESFRGGLQEGLNPFQAFMQPGTDNFANISLTGAQVAVGHAMRLSGAPLALLVAADSSLSSRTETSSSIFTKTTTVIVTGHAKPRWFIGQPLNLLNRSVTPAQSALCASDATATNCPLYATASAGVSFEEFEGGTLSAAENTWEIDRQSKTGLSFIGALIIGVLASYAMVGILGSAGLSLGTGGSTLVGAAAPPLGGLTSFLGSIGLLETGTLTVIQGALIETGLQALSLVVLGGANLSSTINIDAGLLIGAVTVARGFEAPGSLTEYQNRISVRVDPLTTSNMSTGRASLTGFDDTVMGACAPGVNASACGGAQGMIQRADQYSEANEIQFVRENSGNILRDSSVIPAP
jgi:hypothetical protein